MALRRLITAVLAALALVLAVPVGSAQAITNGRPDGDAHPYVGAMISDVGLCSGFLVDPRTFITAAHCASASGVRVRVTVDSTDVGPSSPIVGGTIYRHPDFCFGCGPGAKGFGRADVGLVRLDAPIRVARYARLPALDAVDRTRNQQPVEVVGYGLTARPKKYNPDEPVDRLRAPAALLVSQASTSASFVRVSANPGQGKGGTCFGDSGGPVLVGDTALALNSFGNGDCAAPSYAYRLDTPEAQDFIRSVR